MLISRSRARLRSLLAAPGAVEGARATLRDWDAAALAGLASDRREPWWRRRACAAALDGRVPSACAARLWACVTDERNEAEVRAVLLSVLARTWGAQPGGGASTEQRDAALSWLRAQAGQEGKYGMSEAVLAARGTLGDLGAADALAELAFDPWRHRALLGEQGLAALVAAHGLPALLGCSRVRSVEQLALAGPSSASRHAGVLLLSGEGATQTVISTLLLALEDSDVAVAHRAHLALAHHGVPVATLWAFADARASTLAAAVADAPAPPLTGPAAAGCWALVLLHAEAVRRERQSGERYVVHERDAELYEWLMHTGQPRVPLPEVPEDVRVAILREHLPAQRATDPRFHVEGILLHAPGEGGEHDAMRNGWEAHAALQTAGLAPSEPVPIGLSRQQGGGTYSVLDVAGAEVGVSELGKFVHHPGGSSTDAARVLEAAGFRMIDSALATRVVHGLPVYFFGDREPLSVFNLLFYWQD